MSRQQRLDEMDWSKAKPVAPSSLARKTLGNLAVTGGHAVVDTGEAVVGLADIPTLGRAGKAMEGIGYDPKTTHQIIDRGYSPELRFKMQRVNDAGQGLSLVDGAMEKAAALWDNKEVIPHLAVRSLPLMFGGGAVARGLGKVAPKLSAGVRSAVGEGSVGASMSAEGVRQQTEDGLLTGKQALASIGAGVGTGLFNRVGAKVNQKLGLGDLDTAIAQGALGSTQRGLLARMGGGALVEGVVEEAPQSAQEKVWENFALDRPLTQGVGGAGVEGAAAGGFMGAGYGLGRGRNPQNPQDLAEAPPAAEPLGLPAPEQGLPPYDPFVDLTPPAPPAGPLTRAANRLTENLPQVAPAHPALGYEQGLLGEVLPPDVPNRAALGADPLIIDGEFSEVVSPQNTQGQSAVPALAFEGETVYPSYPAARRAAREQGIAESRRKPLRCVIKRLWNSLWNKKTCPRRRANQQRKSAPRLPALNVTENAKRKTSRSPI